MIRLYGIRNKETGEQVFVDGLDLEEREDCMKFLATTPDPAKYEMISQEVEVALESRGQDLYMLTKRGPVMVESEDEE